MSRLLAPCLALGLALLSACAGPSAGTRDWVTESDESPARKRARLRLELASAYYQQGQDAVALDEVKQALAADAAYAPAWNLRGLVYLRLAQWPLAEESFVRALALAPGDADAAHNLGWLLCQHPQAERRLQAPTYFRRALAQPGYAQPGRSWRAMAVCALEAGRLDEAESSLQHAARADPASPQLPWLAAQLATARGRWPEAWRELQALHARQAPTAESLWLAVRAARKLDNPQQAAELAVQLRQAFGASRQVQALDKGWFDE